MAYLSGRTTGNTLILAACACGVVAAELSAATGLLNTPPASVKTFRVFELALGAASPGTQPYANGPTVTGTFTGTSGAALGKTLVAKGFWDGGNVWRIRFAPTATGDWSYQTISADAGLNGIAGSVTAVAPSNAEVESNPLYRGFLHRDGYAWRLSDGSLFLPAGDTAWSFAEEILTSEWQRWMSARAAQKYNTFLGCIWLAIYSRTGLIAAFPNRDPKTDDLQVAYFQRLDQMVQYANDQGIMMGLTVGGFPGNSNWFNRFGTLARNDRWFRYCVARYAAYNVRWCLYGEVNEANPPSGWGGGITTWQAQVAHDAQLIKDEDPYDHPIGSHHTSVDTSSANNPNIDYIEVQISRTETQYQSALSYRQYGKPVWFEEYWYEATTYDNEYVLGIRNTHRNFVAAMAFPTMGSLMRAHYPDFDINTVETDPGALRMSYFANFYRDLDLAAFAPASNKINSPGSTRQCGKFGGTYAIFLQGGGSVTLDLTGDAGTFAVTRLDINSGATAFLGTIGGGAPRVINSGVTTDVALLVSNAGPPTNHAPTVHAGADQTIQLPAAATLNGTVTDDGLPAPPGAVTITWSKVSGPGDVTFGDASAAATTARFTTFGTYVLRLTAYDGELSASDDVTVTVASYGDFDLDGDLDLTDFSLFQVCFSGPNQPRPSGWCAAADADTDGDVDLGDFATFQGCFNGPNRPPACP